jgi:hypothetical protein
VIVIEFYTSGSGYFIRRCVHTILKSTQASAVISKEASQEVSAEGTKCVYMSCEQNAAQNHNVKTGNKYWEYVVKY